MKIATSSSDMRICSAFTLLMLFPLWPWTLGIVKQDELALR